MNNKKNYFSALLYQLVHIVYGLVVPRIVLVNFGSEVNGLVSSITQFLSFISLLEGGLGAVVLSELYKPLECRDTDKIDRILKSSQAMFNNISLVYVIYTIALGCIYGISSTRNYSFEFVFSLTLILSISTLAEYLFSITYRLYLQADQKIYITNYLSAGILALNILLSFISVKVYPEIRILKLLSSIAFFFQPIVLRYFIPKEFKTKRKKLTERYKLSNRWSGFAQNLAHFINMNTDIILITAFCSYTEVSVYTVYMLAINALRLIVATVANSYQSALGKYIAQGNTSILRQQFFKFSILISGISTILFCTCLLLINQFVNIYTTSVHDADYFRPVFAMVIILANLVYCIREPYRLIVLAAGKFKETNSGAVFEAALNIVISLLLIYPFGLTGIAVGTLIAITYRLLYFIHFLNKNIIDVKINSCVISFVPVLIIMIISIVVYWFKPLNINGIIQFLFIGTIIILIQSGIVFLLYMIANRIINHVNRD